MRKKERDQGRTKQRKGEGITIERNVCVIITLGGIVTKQRIRNMDRATHTKTESRMRESNV